MKSNSVSVKKAAEYLGISVKTLKEWDYQDKLKASYVTPGGHRRYTKEDLDKHVAQQKTDKEQKRKQEKPDMKKHILQYMSMYAEGVRQLVHSMREQGARESFMRYPLLWRQGSAKILELTEKLGFDNFRFPMTVSGQRHLWEIPLSQWRVRNFSEVFEDTEERDTILFEDGDITDYCEELASLHEKEPGLAIFEGIMREARTKEEDDAYRIVRRFLVENPVIEIEKLDEAICTQFRGELRKYQKPVMDMYEAIPREFTMDGRRLKTCAYCGWTVRCKEERGPAFCSDEPYIEHCNTKKCRTHAGKDWGSGNLLIAQNHMRVLPDIQKSIVEPGIVELDLFKKVKKKYDGVVLYPDCDFADLEIKWPNGEVWMIDAKDWQSASALAFSLNEEPLFRSQIRSFNKGFLVVPSSFGKSYLHTLKSRWNDSDKFEVVTDRQFMKQFNARLGEIW